MIRSVLYLRPVAGDASSVARFFEEERVLERAAAHPGFLGGELQLPLGRTGPALVTALWSSVADYQGWVADPWRASSASRAGEVFEAIEEPGGGGSIYEVAVTAAPGPGAKGGVR
jgi:heme-degrading monooxygenase HmoA